MAKAKTKIEERKTKVFYNSEIEDIPFPEPLSYKLLVEIPQELKDINETEGTKLAGIEDGAMNLSNHTSDDLPEGAVNLYDDQDASSRAKTGLTADGFVQKIIKGSLLSGTPEVGINMTNQYLGYYSGSEWKVYIKSDGKFMFKGDSGNYITWNGSVLNIRGQLNADDISAGTLTGRTVQTKSSGARVIIGGGTEWIKFYDSNAEQVILYANGGDFLITGQQSGSNILIRSGTAGEVALCKGGSVKLTTSDTGISVSGNISVTGTVDGVDISAHAGNASAHHTKTQYISEITINIDKNWNAKDITNLKYLKFNSSYGRIYWGGDIVMDILSANIEWRKHMLPYSVSANLNLGSASLYWNEVNYKYLTDRGCLGVFDKGVELRNGKKVSDVEALQSIKKHPRLKTGYGVPRFDYSTMPKAVYRPAPKNKGKKIGEDGAEITALISIMIGAIKELDNRVKILEKK